jgi:hypothetical protein
LFTAIAFIVLADLALIALLVYAMSHAGRLTPHVPAAARRGAARAREAMAEEGRQALATHHRGATSTRPSTRPSGQRLARTSSERGA